MIKNLGRAAAVAVLATVSVVPLASVASAQVSEGVAAAPCHKNPWHHHCHHHNHYSDDDFIDVGGIDLL
ncbi:hypothetical protein [Actinomadura kijaniata]|uniref:hypothetical protein n=1 Tax=Actinomadura kijaniata TaxID=46161 RepID=UPI000830A00A|nr:hypothetical protein [Actinomadura kijaniata]